MLVAGVAAMLLALPAGAVAKTHPKRACQAAAKADKKPRCRTRGVQRSRGVDAGYAAPAAIADDGQPATRTGHVLEI
jgi:hypothetical protein